MAARELSPYPYPISLAELARRPDLLEVDNSGIVLPQIFGDQPDGILNIFTRGMNFPFSVERTFSIKGMQIPDAVRGKHAHRKLMQVIYVERGSFTLLLDDGRKKQSIRMDIEDVGVILNGMIWHEMTEFSGDCKIRVYASDRYEESDYVRDYKEFERLVAASGSGE